MEFFFEIPRRRALILAAALVLTIAFFDSRITTTSLGILYSIPILLSAPALTRVELLLLALACSLLREQFYYFGWSRDSIGRVLPGWLSFGAGGLFIHEIARNRRLVLRHWQELREQMAARREAETHLKSLVESSPAAILTLTSDGTIEMANNAAHDLFGVKRGELARRPVRDFMPVLAGLLEEEPTASPYRTATNCRALRADGSLFLACVWFSTYQTRSGARLSAIVTDASDDLRDYQESSLRSLLRSTRILVGSVSHEIRNMCAAISVVHANLGRIESVRESEDYKALGTLSSGLTRLTKVELQTSRDDDPGSVRLKEIFEEFRIVMQPALDFESVRLAISDMSELPYVSAERHGLLQVLLNLARNSERAMETSGERRIEISAEKTPDYVLVKFRDSGPGVERPERLFQPFQTGADASGLGLFVSRAIIRGFGGEMYHDPEGGPGCTMCIRLRIVQHGESEQDFISTEETS